MVQHQRSVLCYAVGNTSKQIVHLHTTRKCVSRFTSGNDESTMDGRQPVAGTGSYYYKDPNLVGLVSTEDMAVMMDEMGIQTNLDIDKILEIGTMNERIVGRRLRSESIKNGRIPKSLTGR